MEANSKDIEWLLENVTQTLIAEKTGIAQSKISRLKNEKIKMKNLTFEVASVLTDFSKKIQESTKEV